MNKSFKIIIASSLLFVTSLFFSTGFSQNTYEGLKRVEGVSETVYVSKGHEELGKHLASMVEGANRYMSVLMGRPAPKTTLLILSQEDWGKFTNPQIIYCLTI